MKSDAESEYSTTVRKNQNIKIINEKMKTLD